jgi:hypothetical protein
VTPLPLRARLALHLQRGTSWLLAPLWLTAVALIQRFVMRWRIEDLGAVRAQHRRLRGVSRAPLLVCANHLTLVDSALIGWALGSPLWYLAHFGALSWNLPERRNFAATTWSRALMYALKSLPIVRGGERRAVGNVLDRAAFCLQRGESVLVFPEGGRSRCGSVDVGATTYGVGRLLHAVPAARVLCVWLRGVSQHEMSDLPARGERFRVRLALLEPKSESDGIRGSVELARQILGTLAALEREALGDR